jgi:hypothetical protein
MNAGRLAVAALVALTLACGGDSTAPENLVGTWVGTFASAGEPVETLSLTLTENNDNVAASGNLSASGSGGQVTFALSGTGVYAAPHLALTLSAPGYQAIDFEATLTSDGINGTLNGSGYSNQPVTLVPQ